VLRSFEDYVETNRTLIVSDQVAAAFKSPKVVPTGSAKSLSFASNVAFTKGEVFEVCEWLASAMLLLLEDGHHQEASQLSLLFDDLEDRLAIASGASDDAQLRRSRSLSSAPDCYFESACSGFSGSNSSESELMQ
jgi:hypothetical protein